MPGGIWGGFVNTPPSRVLKTRVKHMQRGVHVLVNTLFTRARNPWA
jgi:hypothetical protein